jgi:hypothetical protein
MCRTSVSRVEQDVGFVVVLSAEMRGFVDARGWDSLRGCAAAFAQPFDQPTPANFELRILHEHPLMS